MDHDLPDYYAVLKVAPTATAKQIRDAYKRAALENHPDRVPADSPERSTRTRKFQLVNDAYYTLSDAARRREYDNLRKIQERRTGSKTKTGGSAKAGPGAYSFPSDDDDDEDSDDDSDVPPGSGSGSGSSWGWNYFSRNSHANQEQARQQAEDAQFADVFEEMMREQGMAEDGTDTGSRSRPTHRFWSLVGGLSGGALGFIVANVPGMVAGAVAGNRLGAVRDDKGMSVYEVYQQLPADDRARMLSTLAARVISHAAGI